MLNEFGKENFDVFGRSPMYNKLINGKLRYLSVFANVEEKSGQQRNTLFIGNRWSNILMNCDTAEYAVYRVFFGVKEIGQQTTVIGFCRCQRN